MREHDQIISDAGGAPALSGKLNLSPHTVRSWSQRNRVPPEHWSAIVDSGAASLEELAATHRPRKRPEAA